MKFIKGLASLCVAAAIVSPAYAQMTLNSVVFYSKNNCKGKVVASLPSDKNRSYNCTARKSDCKNDAARSVFIQKWVKLPLAITLWDDSSGSFSDDYASIRIWEPSQSMKTSRGVCIPSFEADYGKTWMNINWNHGDNLDGKVSRIEIGRN